MDGSKVSGVSSDCDDSTGSADTANISRVASMENESSPRAAKACMEPVSGLRQNSVVALASVATHITRALDLSAIQVTPRPRV